MTWKCECGGEIEWQEAEPDVVYLVKVIFAQTAVRFLMKLTIQPLIPMNMYLT